MNGGLVVGMRNFGYICELVMNFVFGCLKYNYMDKYLFEVNVRGDGFFCFVEGNCWGWFFLFLGVWCVINEDFI